MDNLFLQIPLTAMIVTGLVWLFAIGAIGAPFARPASDQP